MVPLDSVITGESGVAICTTPTGSLCSDTPRFIYTGVTCAPDPTDATIRSLYVTNTTTGNRPLELRNILLDTGNPDYYYLTVEDYAGPVVEDYPYFIGDTPVRLDLFLTRIEGLRPRGTVKVETDAGNIDIAIVGDPIICP